MPNKQAHLQMIQEVVKRMANNSFLIKGWSVLLVSAILAVVLKDDQLKFLPVTFLPTLVLWGLDGYFLRQERLFRELYNQVTKFQEKNIDFSMNVATVKDIEKKVPSWFWVTLSSTLTAFHGAILGSVIAIAAIAYFLSS